MCFSKCSAEIMILTFFLSFSLQDRALARDMDQYEEQGTTQRDETLNGEERDEKFPNKLPKYICLSNGLGKMRLRNFPAVLRIHNSKKKEGHEEQYSELLLFTNSKSSEHLERKAPAFFATFT